MVPDVGRIALLLQIAASFGQERSLLMAAADHYVQLRAQGHGMVAARSLVRGGLRFPQAHSPHLPRSVDRSKEVAYQAALLLAVEGDELPVEVATSASLPALGFINDIRT